MAPIIIIQIDEAIIEIKKVIWLNLPLCKLTNINIGKYFLYFNVLNTKKTQWHFNKDNLLSQIFNRNTVKISYSFANNIYKVLNNLSWRPWDELDKDNERMDRVVCNFKRKYECPLDEWCNLENVVYQVCISPMEDNDGEIIYIGIGIENKECLWLYSLSPICDLGTK